MNCLHHYACRMIRIGINEATAQFSRLVQLALDGEEVVITRHGRDAVMLTPVIDRPRPVAVVRGAWKGRVRIAKDFDELPADIAGELGLV